MPTSVQPARLEAISRMMHDVSLASTPQAIVEAFGRQYMALYPTDQYIALSVRGLQRGQYKITRRLDLSRPLPEALAEFRRSNPWDNWDRIPTCVGGFLGEVIQSSEPQIFHDLDLRADPVLGDELAHLHSAIASPLFDAGEPLNWAINFRKDPSAYTDEELEQSFISTNLVGTSTRTMIALAQNRELNSALTNQFEQVARVQQSLLPSRMPPIPGLKIATSYLPSLHAGGDYYDFYRFNDGRWGIMIADVSGHGAAAATVMAMLHALLPEGCQQGVTPESMIVQMNRRLVSSLHEGVFVTAVFVLFDPADGSIEYVRSGHNPPRLRRAATNTIESLSGAGALPLGIDENYEICPEHLTLQPGDTLLLYTDGITEARDNAGELFGVNRLDTSLVRSSGSPVDAIDAIHADLFAFNQRRTREDDQTMVAIQYLP